MEEKNETVTENKSEKKEVVYTKNEKYGQDEINKLVKIYHNCPGCIYKTLLSY